MLGKIMDVLLYVYLCGAIAVALRLIWHMVVRLDRYDWHYKKDHIWFSLFFYILLWPLLFARKPWLLIDPSEVFKKKLLGVEMHTSERMRELDQLLKTPPPCGTTIRYCPQEEGCENVYGEFVFQTHQVKTALEKRLTEFPHLTDDEEGAILNWVCQCDNSIVDPTDVPDAWGRFKYVADDLVRQGYASVRCLECRQDVPESEYVFSDDKFRGGNNYRRLLCAEGHRLLVVWMMHIQLRRGG